MTTFLAVRTGAAVLLALAAAGCAARPAPAGSAPAGPATASSAPAGSAPATIAGTVFANPAMTATGGGLYLRWDLRQGRQAAAPEGIALVDPASGRILAANTSMPGPVGAPAYAAGSLWAIDWAPGGEFLLRLNRLTLAVTGRARVAAAGYPAAGAAAPGSHIALAGGLVWADGAGRLAAVEPSTMAVRMAVAFPHADRSDVAASADGTTLIASEADSGTGSVQRRDPATGALLRSVPIGGVAAPVLAGVASGGVWITEATGMLGHVERYDAATLAVDPATEVSGSNGIRAGLWGGRLWVTDQAGGPAGNYCADQATGRRLAASPLPDLARDYPMTVAGQRLYYLAPAGGGFRIRTVPVPAACG